MNCRPICFVSRYHKYSEFQFQTINYQLKSFHSHQSHINLYKFTRNHSGTIYLAPKTFCCANYTQFSELFMKHVTVIVHSVFSHFI